MSVPRKTEPTSKPQNRGDMDAAVDAPLRVIQLTDSHLFADPAGTLLGLTTRRSFEAVLALAIERSAPVDTLVMTGDLVHDGSPDGYRYLRQALEATGLPCFCIPGNHDQRDRMEEYLGPRNVADLSVRRLGAWNLIFVDSTTPGEDGGWIAGHQLDELEHRLANDAAPSILFLHQHPLPVESAWMDTMDVRNGAALLALCERHPAVVAVVFGHIHQEFDGRHAGARVLGAPSTCVQFLPGSQSFALDPRPPGYRELLLFPDGRVETRVIRLSDYPEPIEITSDGY